MGVGLGIGIALSALFGLSGITKSVVIVCGALPIGFNTLIFANLENMDREFAATIVLHFYLYFPFYIPWLIYIFR
jgi:predicted permease